MTASPPKKDAKASDEGGLWSRIRHQLSPMSESLTGGIASTLNGALKAAGLKLEVGAPPLEPQTRAAADGVPTRGISSPLPGRSGLNSVYPSRISVPPKAVGVPSPVGRPIVVAKPAPEPLAGPTPVQVMSAVQNAVVGAVNMVSGTIAGVRAAGEAARAAGKTATGAADVASGVATVASGFFPPLTKLGIGVKKAPKNRPGMRPQRRVAEIIANPIGKTPPPDPKAPKTAEPRPVKRIQRIPMVRAKSSLELSRRGKSRKVRSYADLQMRPQLGLTPHEILLKVATLALGKTLLGFLEAGARSQQQALQRVNDRMSQKQIMLLGMLPAQYIVQKLPPQPSEASVASEKPLAEKPNSVSVEAPSGSNGAFKIRY